MIRFISGAIYCIYSMSDAYTSYIYLYEASMYAIDPAGHVWHSWKKLFRFRRMKTENSVDEFLMNIDSYIYRKKNAIKFEVEFKIWRANTCSDICIRIKMLWRCLFIFIGDISDAQPCMPLESSLDDKKNIWFGIGTQFIGWSHQLNNN